MSGLPSRKYRPSDDEPFMNSKMTEYFRRKLLGWRNDLLNDSNETLLHLQEGVATGKHETQAKHGKHYSDDLQSLPHHNLLS